MKAIKIIIIRFFLLFYLFSSYLSIIHIHHDALSSQNDCKVCIVVKNLNSGEIPTTEFDDLVYDFTYEPIDFRLLITQKNILKGFNANAPPLS